MRDAAVRILLCRYRGLNSPDRKPSGTLAVTRIIRREEKVKQLANQFNALAPVPPGVTACPSDDASEIVAFFVYPDGSTDPVVVHPLGCPGATNGRFLRTLIKAPGPTLLRELNSLTNEPHR